MLHNWFRIERAFSRWRVRPCFGEPANSYVARLVDDNGYGRPDMYAVKAKLIGSGDPMARMLEAVLKLPLKEEEKESLIRWTPIMTDGQLVLSGERLSKNRLFRQGKFCAACLGEASYHRVWWDIAAFDACPVHGVPLARPEIGSWEERRWPFYGRCRSFSEPPTVAGEQKDTIETYVLHRLGAVQASRKRPLLDDQPLNMTLRYAPVMGRFLANPFTAGRPPSSRQDAAVGFEALGRTSKHLERRIAGWITTNVLQEVRRLGKRDSLGYGATIILAAHASGVLNKRIDDAQLRTLAKFGGLARPLLRKAEGVTGPRLDPAAALAKDCSPSEQACDPTLNCDYDLSLLAAQRRLGLTKDGLKRLLRRVDGTQTKAANGVIQIPRPTSDRIAREIEGAVALPEVCTQIGIGEKELDQFLYVTAKAGQTVCVSLIRDGHRSRHVLGSELTKMLRFLDEVPPCPPGLETVSLIKQAQWNQIKVGTVISKLLSGEFSCFRSDMSGFRGLRFARVPGMVAAYYGGKPSPVGRRHLESEFMLAAEFTAMTGIGSKGIAYLADKGILRRDGAICREEALVFHKTFVNVVAALKSNGQLPVSVARRAREAGLDIQFPYDDVEALMARRPEFEAAFGIRTGLPPAEIDLWREFRAAAAKNCASFIVPELKSDGRSIIRTTTRKCAFNVEIEGGVFAFAIPFAKAQWSRSWRILVAERKAIEASLPSFEWDIGRNTVVAQASAAAISELDVVTAELGKFEVFFRHKMP